MGLDILEEPSWPVQDMYGLIACFALSFVSLSAYNAAASTLWRTKWYERMWNSMQFIKPGPGWFMGLMFFLHHGAQGFALFFLIRDFENRAAHHPANASFVYGLLFAGIAVQILLPVVVSVFCSMWPTFLVSVVSLGLLVTTFALEIRYTQQKTLKQLELTSPAPWLLIFPILWMAYIATLALEMGILSESEDYKTECALDRRTLSLAKNTGEYAIQDQDMASAIAEGTLRGDSGQTSAVPPAKSAFSAFGNTTGKATVLGSLEMVGARHNTQRRDATGAYTR